MSATPPPKLALHGRTIVITRPVGTGASIAARVRALGGEPMLLPGLSLRAEPGVRPALREALKDDLLIFISPAAVRFAARAEPLRTRATVCAVGQGTARVLQRHRIEAIAPDQQQDSEGLLAHAQLKDLQGKRVALIGAPGGRGVLREQLAKRGAKLRELHVYRRAAPRLSRRHIDAVLALPSSAMVLLSSAEALANLHEQLPGDAWKVLCKATAVVSSERLADAARKAGFKHIRMADSAFSDDMLHAAAGTFTKA
ncbi:MULTISPECIES: uroporphyrinogen-III synthase [Dyella]|uniref:Uroporphyrinogen-III synthase n=2 Tax=Dyella TaxID=231454 RepID=A0A4R0YQT0_9GAMM|nr:MULTISPECIES: uroporphyrinogen-III synthase [Dyella]TBR36716.1 uroporphyrinogen-III synthase [Dyella terrae]TCI08193.1 uroporphyrinogen-III synthase [Dyella soli]